MKLIWPEKKKKKKHEHLFLVVETWNLKTRKIPQIYEKLML